MAPRFVVLLGPPGSGKSHLGALLAQRWGLDFVEHEARLVARWGSAAAFARVKAQALAEMEAELEQRLAGDGAPVVFETTGLSDRPMLERLMVRHETLVVQLAASRELCLARVRGRPKGRHFDDEPESAGRFHDHWTAHVAPGWSAHVMLLNDVTAGEPSAEARTEALLETIVRRMS